MDSVSAVVIIIGFFVIVFLVAMLIHPRFKGPWQTGLEIDAGSDEQDKVERGVTVEDVKSRKGGVLAEDQTGRGTAVRRAEVEEDILASSEGPKGNSDSKKV